MSDAPLAPWDVSRRDFLRQSGRLLGGSLLSSAVGLSTACGQQATGDARRGMGVALVGLGSYAMGQLAPALRETNKCHLAGLVTGTPEKAERYGREYDIPATNIYNYDNFDRIADNPDIGLVYVVLPNSMHAEYTIRAAQAGKHVMCEKPMAVSVEECERMIAACRDAGVTLNIGYRLHHDPYNLAIMEVAREQPFGRPAYAQTEFGFIAGDPRQWRLRKALAGGGALMDVGIYCIQAARYSFGLEPVALRAQEFKTDPVKFAEVDETITWQMEFPNGAISNSSTSYNASMQRLLVSYVPSGRNAELSPAYSYRGLRGHIAGRQLDFGSPNQQALHMDAVVEAIETGRPTTTGGDEGLRDMKIITAIYESIAQDGARVELS